MKKPAPSSLFRIKGLPTAKGLLLGTLMLALGACSNLTDTSGAQPSGIDPNFQLPIPTDGNLSGDEQFAKVAKKVPGFAGLFYDDQGVLTARVKGTGELNVQSMATLSGPLAETISDVFGEDTLIPTAVADDLSAMNTRKGARLTAQGRAPQLKVIPADYSFNELASARHNAEMGGIYEVAGVVTLDLDEKRNRLFVGVTSAEAKVKVETKMARLGLTPVATVAVVEAPKESATLRQSVRPLIGGLQLSFAYDGSNIVCSLGFNAVRDGWRGFVTNSHCTGNQKSMDGTAFRQPSSWSSVVGYEAAEAPLSLCFFLPNSRCRSSDSAFVAISRVNPRDHRTNGLGKIAHLASYYSPSAQITNQYTITATRDPIVGQQLIKVGRTTGETYGKVSRTGVMLSIGENIITHNNFFVNRPSGKTAPISMDGDSGSPVFSISSGLNVTLRGILHCGPTSNSGAYYCGSPISGVTRSLGALKVW